MKTSRHTKKTLLVEAVFYIVVGFVAATATELNDDLLGTILGFLIIGGALAATAVLRMGARISAMDDAVTEMHARLGRLEVGLKKVRERAAQGGRSAGNAGGVGMLDLAAMGDGNPDVLAAVTLAHEAYPRLVATMEELPPAQRDEVVALGEQQSSLSKTEATTEDLLRQWRAALGDGDLAGCRGVYAALIDTAGVEAVASLGEPMEELADRVERSLREAFSSRVRVGDYAGGLVIGERICSLLPDRPVTAEVHRIWPYLLERLSRGTAISDAPLAASQ